ncbi:hypothetical protein [Asticcacaulis sp.]|uniref:hypothetical protein n=1 Tax=Asticcacaulis sp. TaxID=1872648 RepID=UPI002631C0AB|nr:hypothetical protein [Asticcacaulis sp.]
MPITQSLSNFQMKINQCDSLIASAHNVDSLGNQLFPQIDREQITVAAFLNLFIAWEEFIESSIVDFMMGDSTTNGTVPTKFVQPIDHEHSNRMLVHTNRYFDYANHENVQKIAKLYFLNGYPFESVISSINLQLSQMKVIRNACAHLSSTTRTSLEAVASRILGQVHKGISVYDLLIKQVPGVTGAGSTVYKSFRDTLETAAIMIARG